MSLNVETNCCECKVKVFLTDEYSGLVGREEVLCVECGTEFDSDNQDYIRLWHHGGSRHKVSVLNGFDYKSAINEDVFKNSVEYVTFFKYLKTKTEFDEAVSLVNSLMLNVPVTRENEELIKKALEFVKRAKS